MRFATWNVNSLNIRLPQVLDWLAAQAAANTPVDVLALQELKLADDKFPLSAFTDAGYHACWLGQKTYNGVALISRQPPQAVQRNLPNFADEQSRIIAATYTLQGAGTDTLTAPTVPTVRVVGGYFPNGQAPGSDKFAYKMQWLQALREWTQAELATHPNLLLMGDYNITFDDLDVWDPEGLRETIHCTTEERQHLQALIGLGLHDAVRLFPQPEKNYSWWDYRDFAFRRGRGLRIDHILLSDALRPHATACAVDRLPRKNERPSDHAPVVLTLA